MLSTRLKSQYSVTNLPILFFLFLPFGQNNFKSFTHVRGTVVTYVIHAAHKVVGFEALFAKNGFERSLHFILYVVSFIYCIHICKLALRKSLKNLKRQEK